MPLAPGLLCCISRRIRVEIPRPAKMPDYPGRTSTPTKWAHASRTLCWTEDSLFGENRPTAGTLYFPDLEWLVDRRYAGADGSRMIAFSAKGGHNLEPHNHNDLGHFILHVGGENLLADLGQGHYAKGYDESLNKTSEGHSIPRINGRAQAKGREYRAEVLSLREGVRRAGESAESGTENSDTKDQPGGGESAVSFVLDLTRAYPVATLKRFIRRFEWHPPGAEGGSGLLLLKDSFEFAAVANQETGEPTSIDEHFISYREPSVEGGTAVWTGENGQVSLEFDRNRLTPTVERFEVSGGNLGGKRSCYRLGLSVEAPQRSEEITLRFVVTAS
jgi:hypothetical protein